jgi:hypothetical protein
MKVAPLRRPSLSADAVARPRARWNAFCACLRIHMHALLRTHTHPHTHTCTQSCTSSARAARQPAARGASVGRVRAAARALTVSSGSATRPRPAAPRARCCPRTCAPTVRPRRAALVHPSRAFGPSLSAKTRSAAGARRARGLGAAATGNAAAAAYNAAWCGPAPGAAAHAQRRHRRERARRRRRERGHTIPPRACTGRATRGAPSPSCWRWTCRAPRTCAARARRATMSICGDERAEATERHHALHAHTPACV